MKKVLRYSLLLLPLAFACNNEGEPETVEIEICDNEEIPAVGVVPEDCFVNQTIEEDFYAFRGEYTYALDLDNDGVVDLELSIHDMSYGVGGPARGEAKITIFDEGLEVETRYLESRYCTRWLLPETETGTVILEYYVDSRLCDLYTEEELAACDTVTVEEFGEFMVQSYELEDDLTEEDDWVSGIVYIAKYPKQLSNFQSENLPQYMVFRKEQPDGRITYGWLEIVFDWGYGVSGVIKSYGIMK